jgi:MFS family permease
MKGSIWLVYADLVLISVATAFFRPAMFAIIPSTVSRSELLAANSFFTAMDTSTEIFGPALAGVLAFLYGYAPLLYIDAATYLVSAICMLLLNVRGRVVNDSGAGRPVIAEMVEGLSYIRRDRLQLQLFLLIFPAYLVGSGLNSLQTPLAKGDIGISDAEFGVFQAVWGAGLVVGSLLLGWFGDSVPRAGSLIGGFLIQFMAAAGMGVSDSFSELTLSAFWVGFGNALGVISLATILMEVTPQGIIGRLFSVRQFALASVRMMAPLVFGFTADVLGVRKSLMVLVFVGAVGTLAVAFRGPWLWAAGGASRTPVGWAGRGLWGVLLGSCSPEFDERQQVTLNIGTTILALLGVIGLLFESFSSAVGFVSSVALAATVGALARSWFRGGRRMIERMFAVSLKRGVDKEGVRLSR